MDILNEIGGQGLSILGISLIFKILFLLVFVGYLVYAFLMTLRIRILQDTVSAGSTRFIRLLSYVHLTVAVIGSLVGVILVLLG